jgi:hypothetical protein
LKTDLRIVAGGGFIGRQDRGGGERFIQSGRHLFPEPGFQDAKAEFRQRRNRNAEATVTPKERERRNSDRPGKELRHSCRRAEGKPMNKSVARAIGLTSTCATGVWRLLICARRAGSALPQTRNPCRHCPPRQLE